MHCSTSLLLDFSQISMYCVSQRDIPPITFEWIGQVILCRIQNYSHLFLLLSLPCRVFQSWQAYTGPALARKHKGARFHLGRARRLVALCFTHWRSELEQARNRLKVLEQRLKHIHFKLTAVTMNHWRTATRGCIALKHFNRGTIRQVQHPFSLLHTGPI